MSSFSEFFEGKDEIDPFELADHIFNHPPVTPKHCFNKWMLVVYGEVGPDGERVNFYIALHENLIDSLSILADRYPYEEYYIVVRNTSEVGYKPESGCGQGIDFVVINRETNEQIGEVEFCN